jgi:hypothetical protein
MARPMTRPLASWCLACRSSIADDAPVIGIDRTALRRRFGCQRGQSDQQGGTLNLWASPQPCCKLGFRDAAITLRVFTRRDEAQPIVRQSRPSAFATFEVARHFA